MFLFSRLSARAPEVITTLLIFSLSSGVLGGILFYMDSASPDVLDDMTSNVPVDMEVAFTQSYYMQNFSNPESVTANDIEDSVAEQEFVLATEQVTFAEVHDYGEEDYTFSRKGFLGADYDVFESFSDAIDVDIGDLTYNDNSCLVEISLFLRLGLEIGENYTIEMLVYNSTWDEVSVERTFTIVGTFSSHVYLYQPYWGESVITYLQIITTRDAIKDTFGFLGHDSYYGLQEKIWVKFDHNVIIQSDTSIVVNELSNIERRIEQDNLPFALVDDFQLIGSVYEFASWSVSMRAIALAFSIPSVIMGVMLIQYNFRLLANTQRRDVGTLKTRGSSGFQAFSWVLSNAIATGFIGSLGAVLTGILAALFSSTVKELLVFDLSLLSGFTILLQPIAIITVFLFSFLVGIVVALPAAIKALLMTPTEAHSTLERETLSDSEKMGSSTVDLLLIGITGWLLAPMMTILAYSGITFLSSALFALVIVTLLGIFLFSFTRLLSRPTAMIKAKVLGRAKRPSIVVGTRLMSRTVLMFKKSETMGTMFIAMVFTAGLFASISATTGGDHMKQVFMFQTGADIVIDVNPSFTNVTLDIMDNITAVEGVTQVSPMYRTTGYVLYWDSLYFGGRFYINRSISIFGVDPETWIDAAFWLSYFAYSGSPSTSIAELGDQSGDRMNIITSFKPIDHYTTDSYGSQRPEYGNYLDLQISMPTWTNITECYITDLLAAGISNSGGYQTYFPGEPDATDFVIADIGYVHACENTTQVTKFYVKIDPYANYTKVMEDIHNVAPHTFNDIESPYTNIDETLNSRATQSVYGAYTLNVIFSLIYLTIGMTIVSIVRVRELRKQFSVLRALGAPNKSIIAASLLETSVGLLLAAIIGGTIGVSLAVILKDVPLLHMGGSTYGLWQRLPVLLAIPLPLVATIVGISIIVSLIATYYILVRTLKLNIAEEIQYNE
ncbi:MAG: FtsX-like permease family protein [Candidatus Thorarchaeota archaeon]|nr:FtsX-like permease family protein [Candidatus Thorarchaeota archaeon]